MSDYTKATDFAVKDSLLTGNPAKVVQGTEIDDEFNAIQTSNNTKADKIVDMIAGSGLTGGGTLAADRTFNVGAGTGITVNADDVALDTANTRNVDHAGVTLTAGAGMTGGGTIEASRTFDVVGGTGITANANDIELDTTFTDGRYLRGDTADAAAGLITFNAGATVAVGDLNVTLGDVTAAAGDFTATAGDFLATAGNIVAGGVANAMGDSAAALAGSVLHLSSNTNEGLGITSAVSSNNGPRTRGYKARGTVAAPAVILNDDVLLATAGLGYDGVSYAGPKAQMIFRANENWVNGTNTGTKIEFAATPAGSTTAQTQMVLDGVNLGFGVETTAIEAKFHVAGAGNRANGVMIDGAGDTAQNMGTLTTRKARGSISVPTAALSGDFLGAWGGWGYGATGYVQGGAITFTAAENFTDIAAGTGIDFRTTPLGSTSQNSRMFITSEGVINPKATVTDGWANIIGESGIEISGDVDTSFATLYGTQNIVANGGGGIVAYGPTHATFPGELAFFATTTGFNKVGRFDGTSGELCGSWSDHGTQNADSKIMKLTQVQYDALTPDADTLYIIVG